MHDSRCGDSLHCDNTRGWLYDATSGNYKLVERRGGDANPDVFHENFAAILAFTHCNAALPGAVFSAVDASAEGPKRTVSVGRKK